MALPSISNRSRTNIPTKTRQSLLNFSVAPRDSSIFPTPKSSPVAKDNNNSNNSNNNNMQKIISSFGYKPSPSPTPLTPIRKGVVTTVEATRRMLLSSDEDEDDRSTQHTPKKRRARNHHLIDDSDDEEGPKINNRVKGSNMGSNDSGSESEDDRSTMHRTKKRRMRNHHLVHDSDDEEDPKVKNSANNNGIDMDSDATTDCSDEEAGLKDTRQLNTTCSSNKVALLRVEFPTLGHADAFQALKNVGGDFTKAMEHLKISHRQSQPDQVIDLSDLSDAESDASDEDENERQMEIQRLKEEVQTVTYYNTAKPQEIMDVTGCKLTMAEKLISLRPFADILDLRDKLKQTRGLSVKLVTDYMDVLEGYSAVDHIIQKIEKIGGKLQDIIDVWQKLGSADGKDDKVGDDDDDDNDAGTHLVDVDINNSNNSNSNNQDSVIYKDAMKGFLTQQPDIVNPEFNLKSYQIAGINWMLLLYRKQISGILADEMGLGKTAQVISFLGRLHELGESGPHMIVVPSSTLDNWMREFERFCPTLEVRCYYGSQNERRELQQEIIYDRDTIHAVVTTYAIAAGRVEDRNFLRRLQFKSMILDEGHMIKNYTSARYGHLMRINAPFRLLLTGTPLQNNLQELVSLLIFIMPTVFSGKEEEVRKIFKLKAGGGGSDEDNKESNTQRTTATTTAQMLSRQRIQRAKKMMTPFVLRRRKAQVLTHLPKKIHHVDYCPMTPNQQSIYSKIVADSQGRYNDVIVDDDKNSKMDKFNNIVMQLRKAADHPLLFRRIYNDDIIKQMAKEIRKEERYWDSDEQYIYEDMEVMTDFELNRLCNDHKTIRHHRLTNEEWMDSGKIQYMRRLLPQMKQKGNKVLIFSQFTSMLDILEPVMKTIGITFLRLDGTTKVGERQTLIDEFNQNDSLDVFLLSTKAGGFGINLTSANVVVMYDMDFNPQNDKQAEDRAHRVGQTKDVIVHKLLSDHTIEQQILAMADIRLRLDKSVSGVDGLDHHDGGDSLDKEFDDTTAGQGMDQMKMKSLLKSALMSS